MLPYIEKFSSKRKDYLVRMFMKGKSYLLKAGTVLKKYDLPIVDRKKPEQMQGMNIQISRYASFIACL